jgi:XTP/dITP diphosphohydrolase
MKELLIASGNAHKIEEIKAILANVPLKICSLKDLPEIIEEPEENGGSFISNARIKALEYGKNFKDWVLADDSGIVVPELGGEPGIYSARYAGLNATDKENREKLKSKVIEKKQQLFAYFVCSLALKKPGEDYIIGFEAHWRGHVIESDRGAGGFGYDPIFVPEGYEMTAAELSAEEKNNISHRGQALIKLKHFLEDK